MRLSLPLIAITAALAGGSAFAQTAAPPGVEHSGGPTATAGSAAQPNRNPDASTAPSTSTPSGATTPTYGSDAAPASAGPARRSSKMMTGPKTTPDPGVERSGGPTATAGTGDQSNVNHGPAPNNPGQQ